MTTELERKQRMYGCKAISEEPGTGESVYRVLLDCIVFFFYS